MSMSMPMTNHLLGNNHMLASANSSMPTTHLLSQQHGMAPQNHSGIPQQPQQQPQHHQNMTQSLSSSKPYSRKVKVGRMTPQRIDRIKELAEVKGIPHKTVESILQQFVSEEDPYVEISLSSNSAVRKGKDGQVTYIKRPLNSFMLYRKSQTQSALAYAAAANLKLNHQSISRIIGLMWQTESGETKEEFARFAGEEKELHRAMHPDYKFSPQKKNKKGHPEVQAVTRRPLNPPQVQAQVQVQNAVAQVHGGVTQNPVAQQHAVAQHAQTHGVAQNPVAQVQNPTHNPAHPPAHQSPQARPPSQPMMEMGQMGQSMAYVSPTSRHVPSQQTQSQVTQNQTSAQNSATSPLHHQSPLQTPAQQYQQYSQPGQNMYQYPYEAKRESFGEIKRENMGHLNLGQGQQQGQGQQGGQGQQAQQVQAQQQQAQAQQVMTQQQQAQQVMSQQQQQQQAQQVMTQQQQQAQQQAQQAQQAQQVMSQQQQVMSQQQQQQQQQPTSQTNPPPYQYNQTYPQQHQYHYPMQQQAQQQQQHPGLPMPMQHHMENNMPYYQVPTGYNYSYTNMPTHSHPMN